MHYLLPFFRWCDSTWLAETIRDSRFYFPVIETFHLFALTVLLGAVFVLDLRLFRVVLKRQSVRQLALDLAAPVYWSVALILVTGVLLFLSEALKCYASTPFQLKIALLFPALIFHFSVYRKFIRAQRDPSLLSGIFVGAISLLLWFGVGFGGRAIGFF